MITEKAYNVGIYVRLSKDDERAGESVSIENQKMMLTKYVGEQPTWTLISTYCDDGYSGTHFDRPSFQRMLNDAKAGIINLIIVKDLSRFGRNYIEVGQFTDYIFPAIGCRFVALADSVDTLVNSSNNDIMVYKNLFNEFHSRDTSKKVKASRKVCAENGKFMGSQAPFGYKKSFENKHKLIPHEATAPIVQKIFKMRSEGTGYRSIAQALNDEKALPPHVAHYTESGMPNPVKSNNLWSVRTIQRLLQSEVYIGHMVQFKTGSISYKNRKLVEKPQEDWIRVENTHEPIVDIETWDKVCEINNKKHKPRTTVSGESNMFVGLLKCADCGFSMRFMTRYYKHRHAETVRVNSFLCSNYAKSGKGACKSHCILEKVIIESVLEDIRKNALLVSCNEKRVISEIIKAKSKASTDNISLYKKEHKACKSRIIEFEKIIQNLYEDRVKGTIPETVFKSLMEKYETERLDKTERLETLQELIGSGEQEYDDIAVWAKRIKKYTELESLDSAILWELIDRIEIGEAEIIDGIRKCKINIIYKFVEINLADLEMGADNAEAV